MRIFPFKSLTMRIWSILTAIIIVVVVCISLVQLLILGNLNEAKEREILQVSHRLAINDLQRNQLQKSVERGKIHHILIEKKGNLVEILQPVKDASLLGWMASFIQEDQPNYHQQFKERFKKRSFLFEISHLTDDLYLISYIPLEGSRHVWEVVAGGLVVILFGFLIAKLIANNLAKPLQQLEEYTKRIAKKDWEYEVEIKSNDEIGRLAIAMNEMKRALRQADEEEKKFLQSISHDLKTPVMVIMSYAQAIIDGVYIESVDNMATTIKKEA
jgi:two-component system sensor histidine kinase CssS